MSKTKSKLTIKEPWPAPIKYPSNLPISLKAREITDAIAKHQVIIIAGETGSGKTTQLPKICLAMGYGQRGQIAHTQPRRIAARTVANRIASELNTQLGEGVGYQVRFTDKSSADTRIKLMTDGVLLAEFQHDRRLSKYDVIIIDEAHERSLNIDFLLGLLKSLCKKRPELKIIITSATIDLAKFAEHFSIKGVPAPIIEVSGRTFPVETLYWPPQDENHALPDVIVQTCEKVIRGEAKGEFDARGDILVFCAGEREIRESALALRRANLPVEILPLYSRLSIAEQNKVFQSAQRRKVVLATNVAETSLTVPGIAYVIDPGLARISRYSFRSKVQRLPIEPVSQASANQRKGRSGRVANGVCIRLYTRDNFDQRLEYTPAEILRSNLASVVLKMLRLGISDISKFAFIDRPDTRLLNDAFKLLVELNAIDADHKLTKIGRQMSDLPVDPKYARILIAANELGCLRDALVVVSGLSIQDPRERPADKQQAADQKHQELHHPQSDFFGYLHVWQAIHQAREELSNSQFKQHCSERYWSIARVFEWRELFRQLLLQCKKMGYELKPWEALTLPEPGKKRTKPSSKFSARYENLHRALIPGLVSNIANRDIDGEYLATRNRRIHLFPGSAVAKHQPKWAIAGEYLETSRLFALTIGEIKPLWVADEVEHLCRYNYSGPYYHTRSGTIKAYRKTLLYGLTVKNKESVNYAPINLQESREVFIQQALVEGRYQPRGKIGTFVSHNQDLIIEIEKVETKTRRRNLLADDNAIQEFFNERLPAHINSRQSLETWLAKGNESVLELDRATLVRTEIRQEQVAQFPDTVEVLGKEILLEYKFDPGRLSDGVTMVVPIPVLAPFPNHIGDWLVPGLLREKCIALIKTLPKPIRRNFAPAADTIDRIIHLLQPSSNPLVVDLAQKLYRATGVKVEGDDFNQEKLDQFYHMNYRVLDVDNSLIEEGRNLAQLKSNYANAVKESVHSGNAQERLKLEIHDISKWDFGELAKTIEYQHQGMTVQAYPTLVSTDDTISLLIHDDESVAAYQTHHGVIELAKRVLASTTQKQSLKYLRKELMANKVANPMPNKGLSALGKQLRTVKRPLSDRSMWVDKLINVSLSACCFDRELGKVRTKKTFDEALLKGGKKWVETAMQWEGLLSTALEHRGNVLDLVDQVDGHDLHIDEVKEDIKAQVYRLFEPSFLSYTGLETLRQYPRYLRAIESRIEKLKFSAQRKPEELALDTLQKTFNDRVESLSRPDLDLDYVFLSHPALAEFRLMLEEWRVSIYAQHLRAKIPVSEKRLNKFWQGIDT